ncbi:hypothetical protein J4573_31390 [Actinomadura barringtoniae]|uniref:Uncharacterized protein n=1 Tax=Actinomadura barringtoniae TaxID=1427535 RepID=A0A939PFE3_9ACTN|nr:hypothetical protein [Actinomadura barringtoniae]MBO2451631.1 hypothetical protein [Actinomadura barringtoniae]
MLDRGEVGAVVVLLEGMAAQHPDEPLSVLAVRVAAALHARITAGEAGTPPAPGLDAEVRPGPRTAQVTAAEERREAGQKRDLHADARDDAAEIRDEQAAARAARAVESARTAEAGAARISELFRLAELRDDVAARQPLGQRTPEQQQRADEEDRASNRVDRAALRAFLLSLQVDRATERHTRHADAQNRFASRRDRTAAHADRKAAEGDRDQTLIDVEALAERLHWTRQNIINLMRIIERAEHLGLIDLDVDTDPVALAELEAAAHEAAQHGE